MQGNIIDGLYEDVTLYHDRKMNDKRKFGDGYSVMIEGDKARVQSNNFFVIMDGKGLSRLNKLEVFAVCHNNLCALNVKGKRVYFKIPKPE